MKLREWWKKATAPAMHTAKLQTIRPKFKTVDGEIHYGIPRTMDANAIACSLGEARMDGFKSAGYIYDEFGVMHVLQNVVSVEWEIISEIEKQVEKERLFQTLYY